MNKLMKRLTSGFVLITIIFVSLKLTGLVKMSWGLALFPLIFCASYWVSVVVIGLIGVFIFHVFQMKTNPEKYKESINVYNGEAAKGSFQERLRLAREEMEKANDKNKS